jgi:hypothetical protein
LPALKQELRFSGQIVLQIVLLSVVVLTNTNTNIYVWMGGLNFSDGTPQANQKLSISLNFVIMGGRLYVVKFGSTKSEHSFVGI